MADTFNFELARKLANAVARPTPGPVTSSAISSFEEAKRAAWEGAYPVSQKLMDVLMNTKGYEPRLNWTDLREHMAGRELRGPIYDSLVRTDPPLIDSLFEELRPILAGSEEATEVMDDIVADIFHVVLSRHIHGPRHYFWEPMLRSYHNGFWP